MQRLHEWKAVNLTLRDLRIIRQRYERMSKWKQMLEQRIASWYPLEVSRCHSKPATSLNPTVRANEEVSQKDEGRNVRMVK
jgi:hypothetical protein